MSSSSVMSLRDLAGCLEPARDPRCAGVVFQGQRWGNFCETGWSAYGLFRAHGYHLELSLTDLNGDVIFGQVTLTSLLRSPNIFFLSPKFALAFAVASITQTRLCFGYPVASNTETRLCFGYPVASNAQTRLCFGYPHASSTQTKLCSGCCVASNTPTRLCFLSVGLRP